MDDDRAPEALLLSLNRLNLCPSRAQQHVKGRIDNFGRTMRRRRQGLCGARLVVHSSEELGSFRVYGDTGLPSSACVPVPRVLVCLISR